MTATLRRAALEGNTSVLRRVRKVDITWQGVQTTVSMRTLRNQALRLPVSPDGQITPDAVDGGSTRRIHSPASSATTGASPELFSLTVRSGRRQAASTPRVRNEHHREALYGKSNSTITFRIPRQPLHSGAPHLNLADNKFYNGATFDGFVDRPRTQFVGAGSYFANLGGNSHNFKAGVDWQNLKSSNFFRYPNSQLFIDESFDWQTRQFAPYVRLDFVDAPSTSEGTLMAFYARDKFDIGRRLFVEAGLRYEMEQADNDQGTKVLDTSNISPGCSQLYLMGTAAVLLSTDGRLYSQSCRTWPTVCENPQQANYDLFVWNG